MFWLFLPALVAAVYFPYHIPKHLNSSIDPCDDFYQHVCSPAVKAGLTLEEKRMNDFTETLEQIVSPKIRKFTTRIKEDIANFANDSMSQEDEQVVKKLMEGTDCKAETPLKFLGFMEQFDAYHRFRLTPHYNIRKTKLTHVFLMLKEILIKELSEAQWTERYNITEIVNSVKFIDIETKDFQLVQETETLTQRYEECSRNVSKPTRELARKCYNYAVCSLDANMSEYIQTDKHQKKIWNNFTLIDNGIEVVNGNEILPSPMYYTVEEDDLPYMMGYIDAQLSEAIGRTFFKKQLDVHLSNLKCFKTHLENTCSKYRRQSDPMDCHMFRRIDVRFARLGDHASHWIGIHTALKVLKNYFPADSKTTRNFFYAYALYGCSKSSREGDGHHLRVNGIASLFPEFAEAFECKRGSWMNKAGTCLPFVGLGAPARKRQH